MQSADGDVDPVVMCWSSEIISRRAEAGVLPNLFLMDSHVTLLWSVWVMHLERSADGDKVVCKWGCISLLACPVTQ